jgi:DNA-binding NtrC family response regulator
MPGEPQAARKTVLLVDDEDFIRQIGAQMLARMGYTALTAADGAEALALLERHKDGVDVVLFDLRMPGVSGVELLERMKEVKAGLKFILSSGFGKDAVASAIMDRGCHGFIQKPFRMADLAHVIEVALKA